MAVFNLDPPTSNTAAIGTVNKIFRALQTTQFVNPNIFRLSNFEFGDNVAGHFLYTILMSREGPSRFAVAAGESRLQAIDADGLQRLSITNAGPGRGT